MTGSAVWTEPTEQVALGTANAALLNAQVRDNLTYLKGLITNVALQDVSIKTTGLLQVGGYSVLVTPGTAKCHVEGGSATASSSGAASVTFAKPFNVANRGVAVCGIAGGNPSGYNTFQLEALPSGTGFTFATRDLNGNRVARWARWLAIGED